MPMFTSASSAEGERVRYMVARWLLRSALAAVCGSGVCSRTGLTWSSLSWLAGVSGGGPTVLTPPVPLCCSNPQIELASPQPSEALACT
eukprot:271643-Amphidinium_carterae.1